jgi:hypothetical protein
LLQLWVGQDEFLDSETNRFIKTGGTLLMLEHSLASLSKWEETWEVPFISTNRTTEQTIDYIRCMVLNPDVDDTVLSRLRDPDIVAINEYIGRKMTATTIAESNTKDSNKRVITAELLYHWMIGNSIPMECQYWHLNKLLMLIRVISEENTPPDKRKKMSRAEIMERNRRLNAERRQQMNSKG